MDTPREQPNNPLHGLTLEKMLTILVQHYGWDEMYQFINIQCFYNEPSLKSSLKFLRRTPWARERLEEVYLYYLSEQDTGNR